MVCTGISGGHVLHTSLHLALDAPANALTMAAVSFSLSYPRKARVVAFRLWYGPQRPFIFMNPHLFSPWEMLGYLGEWIFPPERPVLS